MSFSKLSKNFLLLRCLELEVCQEWWIWEILAGSDLKSVCRSALNSPWWVDHTEHWTLIFIAHPHCMNITQCTLHISRTLPTAHFTPDSTKVCVGDFECSSLRSQRVHDELTTLPAAWCLFVNTNHCIQCHLYKDCTYYTRFDCTLYWQKPLCNKPCHFKSMDVYFSYVLSKAH